MQSLISSIQLGGVKLKRVGNGQGSSRGPNASSKGSTQVNTYDDGDDSEGVRKESTAARACLRSTTAASSTLNTAGDRISDSHRPAAGHTALHDAAAKTCLAKPPTGAAGAAASATRIDPSLFGHRTSSFSKPTAQTARAAIMARLKEQETAAARHHAGVATRQVPAQSGTSVTPAPRASGSENKVGIAFGLFGRGRVSQARGRAKEVKGGGAQALGDSQSQAQHDEENASTATGDASVIFTTRL